MEMPEKKEQIKINWDVARVKEHQLKELAVDNQNQSQKTWQLLWFFWAVSAIIFWQTDLLKNIPWPYLWIIFTIIVLFLVVCIVSFQGRKVNSFIDIPFWNSWNELDYLSKKIIAIEKSKESFQALILKREQYNRVASILFSFLIFIYVFICLIYNPMHNSKEPIFKWSDIQVNQPDPIEPSKPIHISIETNTWNQTIWNQSVMKSDDKTGQRFSE